MDIQDAVEMLQIQRYECLLTHLEKINCCIASTLSGLDDLVENDSSR